MKVHHALICFFFLSLQDGNTGLLNPQSIAYSGIEGADLTFDCPFPNFITRKFFCKEECKQDDILIETPHSTAQRGRYSIQRTEGRTVQYFVTITQLTKSDSGRYRCGWDGFLSAAYNYIEIIVVDALLTGDSSKEQTLHTRTGGNIVVECSFPRSGNRKYFCKRECKKENVLVETTDSEAEKDRYSIRYLKGLPSGGFLFVTISQLTKSDSGRYRCSLDSSHRQFRISVTDAPATSTPDLNLPEFSSAVPSTPTPTTTQNLSSSSEGSTTPYTGTTRDVLLYVGLTLLVLVIISLSVLIIYRKRTSKAKDTPVETETNQVYENIREDRRSRSPPLDSSVHTYTIYSKSKRAETNDDYSTATAARSQNTVEDDSSRLTYSELKFSNQAVGSSSRALQGDGDNVIYSVPRV